MGAAFGDIGHLCQVRKNVFCKQIPLQFDSGLALAFSRREERKGRESRPGPISGHCSSLHIMAHRTCLILWFLFLVVESSALISYVGSEI